MHAHLLPDPIEAREGGFGQFPFGPWAYVQADVMYVGQGCDGMTMPSAELTGAASVLLFDRGGCPFTTKVANGQEAGANAVIVANIHADGPGSMLQIMTGDTEDMDAIQIPSLFVNYDARTYMKDALDSGKRLTVSLDWRRPEERAANDADTWSINGWLVATVEEQAVLSVVSVGALVCVLSRAGKRRDDGEGRVAHWFHGSDASTADVHFELNKKSAIRQRSPNSKAQ